MATHRVLGCVLALSLCLGLGAPGAEAQRVLPVDKPIVVRLQLNKPTSIEFPEPIVDVMAVKRPDLFSLNTSGPYLYLFPIVGELDERLFVVDMKGKQYQVDFKMGSPPDSVVRLVVPVVQPVQQVRPFDDGSLLRALRLGRPVPGWKPVDMPLPMLPDQRVAVMGSVALGQGTRLGQALRIRNLTDQLLEVDDRAGEVSLAQGQVVALQAWGWPPRLDIKAITAVPQVLEPGAEGSIYIVFTTRSQP